MKNLIQSGLKSSFIISLIYIASLAFAAPEAPAFLNQEKLAAEYHTPLTEEKRQELESFATVMTVLENLYVNSSAVQSDILIDKALKGMASGLDPYTTYLTPKQFSKFSSNFTVETTDKNLIFKEFFDGYVYLKLSFFQKDVSWQIYQKIKEYEQVHQSRIKGMIFDLRDNPGGLLDEAIKVSNLFLDRQLIVSIESRDQKRREEVRSTSGANALNYFPMIVLVNKGTASSSEIVAGALQDSKRASIMGTKTYGKSTIQDVIPLPNGGAIKVTTARYYTPHRKSIEEEAAIIPDLPKEWGDSRDDSLLDQDILTAYHYLGKGTQISQSQFQKDRY